MSSVVKRPIVCSNPPCANVNRIEIRRQNLLASKAEKKRKHERQDDFISYDISDEEDETVNEFLEKKILNTSYNFVDYINSRESDLREKRSFDKFYATRHILSHDMFKEQAISLNNMNKVFCSQWLSERQIAFGTKCNKLLVYDINTNSFDRIPTVTSRDALPESEDQQSGIHFLQINPSRTMLVTGASASNHLAVYRLPTLDPIAIAEEGHKDWVFDALWLDDQYFISGGKDSKMGLWQVSEEVESHNSKNNIPSYVSIKPTKIKDCRNANKIRSLCFNKNRSEFACLSLNGYIHVFNADKFSQTLSKRLPSSQENVCITTKADGSLYAIGCRSYTLLLDARTLQPISKVSSRYSGCGIRSLSFQSNLLTIGTGIGMLMFYDVRNGKYLESHINASRTVVLRTSRGFVYPEEEFAEQGFQQMKYTPAIYTHCYDHSSTRLFAAGGPLPASMFGNYAAIWQ